MAVTSEVTPPIDARSRSAIIVEDGLFSGIVGGLAVAIFFLIVDLLRGEPLGTPSFLGSLIFLGKAPAGSADIHVPLVFGFTALHMAAFVVVGVVMAFLLAQFKNNPPFVVCFILLFICFQGGFMGLAASLAPNLLDHLGMWPIVLANLVSAGTMAGYLWWSHPHTLEDLEQIWDD